MYEFRKLFLFIGSNIKDWDPSLIKVTKNFFNKKVLYVPEKVIFNFNILLNLLWNAIILKKIVWIIDPEKKCFTSVSKYSVFLFQNKVIYITNLSEGFLTNKGVFNISQTKIPVLAIFISIKKNVPLLLELKKNGVVCVGFVNKRLSRLLDYSIYSSSFNKDFIFLLFHFLFFVLNQQNANLNISEKLPYLNFLNEKIKL